MNEQWETNCGSIEWIAAFAEEDNGGNAAGRPHGNNYELTEFDTRGPTYR